MKKNSRSKLVGWILAGIFILLVIGGEGLSHLVGF